MLTKYWISVYENTCIIEDTVQQNIWRTNHVLHDVYSLFSFNIGKYYITFKKSDLLSKDRCVTVAQLYWIFSFYNSIFLNYVFIIVKIKYKS